MNKNVSYVLKLSLMILLYHQKAASFKRPRIALETGGSWFVFLLYFREINLREINFLIFGVINVLDSMCIRLLILYF